MKLSREMIEKEVVRMTGEKDTSSDIVLAGKVLLAATQTGARVCKIAAFLGVRPGKISEMCLRLRISKVFLPDGRIRAQWFEEDGGIAFNCDVMVACGLMVRAQ